MEIQYTWEYILQGLVGSWTKTVWLINIETDSLSCTDIQASLNYIMSPDAFPTDCNFITLDWSGVVLFMNPNTQQLVKWISVYQPTSTSISEADLYTIFMIEEVSLILIFVFIFFNKLLWLWPRK